MALRINPLSGLLEQDYGDPEFPESEIPLPAPELEPYVSPIDYFGGNGLEMNAYDVSEFAPSTLFAPELSQDNMRAPLPAYPVPEPAYEPTIFDPPTGLDDPYRRSEEQYPLRDVPVIGGLTNVLTRASNLTAPPVGFQTDPTQAALGGLSVAPGTAMIPSIIKGAGPAATAARVGVEAFGGQVLDTGAGRAAQQLVSDEAGQLDLGAVFGKKGTTLYHGTRADFPDAEISLGKGMYGIHLTDDIEAATPYSKGGGVQGSVKAYELSPDAKTLDLSDGDSLWAFMEREGILEPDDLADVDLENYVRNGQVFQYDVSSRTHYADDVAKTAQYLGYDVVKMIDDLGGRGGDIAYVVVNPAVLKPQSAAQRFMADESGRLDLGAIFRRGGQTVEPPVTASELPLTGGDAIGFPGGAEAAQGRWFTDEPRFAAQFANVSSGGAASYIDVPESVALSYSVDATGASSRGLPAPFKVLPEDLSGQATPFWVADSAWTFDDAVAQLPAVEPGMARLFRGHQPTERLTRTRPPEPPDGLPMIDSAVGKERGYAESVRLSEMTPEELQARLTAKVETYDPISNKITMEEATRSIQEDAHRSYFRAMEDGPPTRIEVELGRQLARQSLDLGDVDRAEQIVRHMAERLTEAGQAVQAASLWGRVTPDGILKHIGRAKDKGINVTDKVRDELLELAKELEGMPPGTKEKLLAEAKLGVKLERAINPPTSADKLAAILRIVQLLNPKTIITRNEVSNLINQGFSNLSAVVATPVDMLLAMRTGERSRTLPNLGTQARGMWQGGKEEALGAFRGLPTARNKYGTGAFESGPAMWAERALRMGLGVSDGAHWQAAHDEGLYQAVWAATKNAGLKGTAALEQQAKLLKNPTKEMEMQAAVEGAIAVYEHPNIFSKIAVALKDIANMPPVFGPMSGKEIRGQSGIQTHAFGLGNFLINYPNIPGGLLATARDYSPIGFLHVMPELARLAVTGKATNQKALADRLGKAIVGSGLTYTGYVLANQGIITVKEIEPNRKASALEETAGVKRFQVNKSALARYFVSFFDEKAAKQQPGDDLFTFDWDVPRATALAMGAAFSKDKPQKAGPDEPGVLSQMLNIAMTATDATGIGMDVLSSASLFQGVMRAAQRAGNGDLFSAITGLLVDAPSAFVPSMLGQLNQLADNTVRETYDPEGWREGINKVVARIPVLSATLPAKVDVLGNTKERYQGGTNDLWNVLLNPGFATEYLPGPEAQMLTALYQSTGNADALPRMAPKRLKVDGKTFDLSPEQYVKLQEYMGTTTRIKVGEMMERDAFKTASDPDKAKAIAKVIRDISDDATDALRAGILTVGARSTELPPPSPTATPRAIKPTATPNPLKGLAPPRFNATPTRTPKPLTDRQKADDIQRQIFGTPTPVRR